MRQQRAPRVERGAALILVIVLVTVAMSVAALLLVTSQSAKQAADERVLLTQARLAARSALAVGEDALNRTGEASLDGDIHSLESIHAASGAPTDLRDLPDGSFTVRAERRGESAAGPHFVLTAYAKVGKVVHGLSGVAEPVRPQLFPGGFFGADGVSIAGLGRVEAYDSRSSLPDDRVLGVKLLGSNRDISLGSSQATGDTDGSPDEKISGVPAARVRARRAARYALSAAEPFFRGGIYAPLADVRLSSWGGGSGGPAGRGLDVFGDVEPGRGGSAILGPNVAVSGSTLARERAVVLRGISTRPPEGLASAGVLAVASETRIGPGRFVYDSVAVSGGPLRIAGEVHLHVLGDLDVLSGSIALDPGAKLCLYVGGSVRLDGLGIQNPGPANRLTLFCSADSAVKPGAGVDLKVRSGPVAGAIAGRTVKSTGNGVDLRVDRALGDDPATPSVYRLTVITTIQPPW